MSVSIPVALTRRQTDLREALVELVLAQGFRHLTMDDFAAQLGCSKRTLYALADSKEQLQSTETMFGSTTYVIGQVSAKH